MITIGIDQKNQHTLSEYLRNQNNGKTLYPIYSTQFKPEDMLKDSPAIIPVSESIKDFIRKEFATI